MAGQSIITAFGFFVLKQDEIGVRLTLGKYSGAVHPGLGFCIPILQQILKTRSSLQTVDLPDQQIVLSGNISVIISGNLNFRVVDASQALLDVTNYRYSVQQLALTTISDVLGTKTIEEVRSAKVRIADEIETIVSRTAVGWGLSDVDIRLTDARMDEGLQRAMMRETEARKEASAIKIKAESDKFVSRIFADAARTLAGSPGAMTLRVLQTLSDVSNDKTTVIVPIPVDMLAMLGGGSPASAARAAALTDVEQEEPDDPYPIAALKLIGRKTVAICPSCETKYNVTDVLGDMERDELPDITGQQVKCKRCGTTFTLPEAT